VFYLNSEGPYLQTFTNVTS